MARLGTGLAIFALCFALCNCKVNVIQSLDGTWVGRETDYFDPTLLEYENVNLVFDGVDTFADIVLNNVTVGSTTNMFVRYVFDVKDILKAEGNNTIVLKFINAPEVGLKRNEEQLKKYRIPWECPPDAYRGVCHINMIRKMQASFAWDWGVALPSMGIWKPVYIEAFDETVIRHLVPRVSKSEDESKYLITINTYFAPNQRNTVSGTLNAKIYLDNNEEVWNDFDIFEKSSGDEDIVSSVTLSIDAALVQLWWPNGYGEQPLYELAVSFTDGENGATISKKVNIGFRFVELVEESLEKGQTFYFKVNGEPIFVKGSNEIPINILPELGQDRQTIRYLLQSAKEVNMNMLRVWGGGVYESDYFYEIADQLGIMIWQDFMFACSLYPANELFLADVVAEVDHNIKRLYHHPSIVVYSGNNENEGVLSDNWYSTADNYDQYKADYVALYIETVRAQFERISGGEGVFISSSPSNAKLTENEGWVGQSPSNQYWGDVHFYNYVLDSWNSNSYPIPRFCSEYGYQSFPLEDSWMTATNITADLKLTSEFMDWRQHHPLGNEEIALLISENLQLPDSESEHFSSAFFYLSQIYSAQAIRVETEHYRRYRSYLTEEGNGYTMGALYWQLNDVWWLACTMEYSCDPPKAFEMPLFHRRDLHETEERSDDPFCNPENPVKITFEEITSAAYKIRSGIKNTPCEVSFKERGARYALLKLSDEEKSRGVIAASLGNHAQAVCYHGHQLGIPVTGTIALEILEQVPDIDAIVVPTGGGGLLAGVSVAVKMLNPSVKVIGVESERCASYSQAMANGGPTFTPIEGTLADGLAVPEVGYNAWETSRNLLDKLVVVKEEYIALAILRFIENEKCVVEGAGACGLVLILSGGNIDTTILGRCLERGLAADGRLVKCRVTVSDRPGGICELCKMVSSIGVSIKDIVHERAWVASDVFSVEVIVVCETRDYTHMPALTVGLFFVGIGFMLLYYRYFHVRRLMEKPTAKLGPPGGGVFNCRFAGYAGSNGSAPNRKKKKPTTFVPPPSNGAPPPLGPVAVPFWRRPLPSSSENEGSSVGSRVNIHQKLQEKKQKQLAELKIIEEEIKQGKLVGPESADFDDRQPIPRVKKHVEPQLLSLASLNNLVSYGVNLNRRPAPRAPRNRYVVPSSDSIPTQLSARRTPELLLTPRYLYCDCDGVSGLALTAQMPAELAEIGAVTNGTAHHSVGSDLESQISLPRSYTLPREFKYYRRQRMGRPIQPVASTNSSDGDVDSGDDESDSNPPPPALVRPLRRAYRHETQL
ncbi:hypothetical protein HUJ05_007047 [Dendroctonus ponderosae]|nr:hypothetical protein HUJ05_007047 [Dendroctonus ponderosae]